MSFQLASSEAIAAKAGIHANSKVTSSGALMAQFSDEAEQFVNFYTRYNWLNAPSILFASSSAALQEAVSALAAIQVISHDTTAFQPGEADFITNVLNYKAFKILDLLKEDQFRKFAIDGSTGAE